MTVASLKWETTDQVSLKNLLRLAHALGRLHEFAELFDAPQATSLAELKTQAGNKGILFYWLQRNLEFSPFTLPMKSGLIEHKQREFGPLFGLFDDSLPDGWGLLLMDRHFRSLNRDPASLTPIDRLLYLGRFTMGALTYHPPIDQSKPEGAKLNLHELASLSQQILAGDEVEILPLPQVYQQLELITLANICSGC